MALHLWLVGASGATTTTPTVDAKQVLHDSFPSLVHLLVAMWPLWAILAVIGAGKVLVYGWRVRRLTRAGMLEIDRMSGHEFERKLALMFRSLGYRSEVVGSAGGDFGGDLVVSKDGIRTVVQAKCWKKNVGVKAIQEAVAAKAMYQADAAMVVTNSRFTKQAQQLASKNKVKLWGRDELVVALLKGQKVAPVEERANGSPSAPAFVAAPVTETTAVVERAPAAVASPSGAFCARCGGPVSVKVRDYCLADSERFGGLVYCFKDQRAFKSR